MTNLLLAIAISALGTALVFGLLTAPESEQGSEITPFSAVHDRDAQLNLDQALEVLRTRPARTIELPTNRSEDPFWLLSEPLTGGNAERSVLELPSRHIQELSYWILDEQFSVVASGKADRLTPPPEHVRRIRAGFTISDPSMAVQHRVVLRVVSSGPARLTLAQRSAKDLEEADQHFDRTGGVLFGSLLMIAAFSALIALLARDYTFFLFGAWVVSSLRIASYSAGWDFGWLGFQEVELYPLLARNVPLAAYATFTVTLFWSIFRREIGELRASNYIRILLVISLGLVLAGLVLPHRYFLPLLWSTVAPSVAVLMWLTLKIFRQTGSAAAAWYGASWIATLAGGLSEVAFAAGLTSSKPTLLSSLGSSVVSALLAGIAVAQRLNSEKSARLAAQAKTVSALTRFRENYNSMPVGLFSMLPGGTVTLFNPAFADMFRVQRRDDSPSPLSIDSLLGHGSAARLKAGAESITESDVEFQVRGPDANSRWFLARVTSKGTSIEGSIQDITIRKEAESQLKHLVDHDSLTGLLNRRGLELTLEAASSAASEGVPCAIAHVDMDRFKLINDLYGHAIGDGMLQAAATRLTNAIRAGDRIARMADSFIIILMDCPDHAMTRLMERLRETVGEHPFDLEGKSLSMTVSIGVVPVDPAMSAVDMLTAADRACAEAKSRGRNCVVRLSEQDAELKTHLDELKVVAGLRQRVPTERYFLEFQPIVSLRAAHQSLNYEVLIRMRAEDGTISPPGQFIGAAERNGLMSQIDRWVLRSTLEWLDQHPEHRDRLTFATINISGASLNDARFVDDAFSMIAEHPLAMTKLCFEITESIALHDLGSTRRFVDRVRAYGSKLALDDFGAGYTSFSYLKEIPADFIKIDGSFVRDIHRNPANYAITRTIVDLTHELGMRCIAEWAETADTIAALMELRVDYGQGFALARPLAKELVTVAQSSVSLVRDERVLQLLEEQPVPQLITLRPGNGRRH